ncbi:hypothetical protein AB0M20_20690 [Actinoplanes sp. NPDC051633]|uniref:hypothetical protein n=1 Tax=Actinoplanes sp. NPDC051633 TaxID=3155670 RepID=UPI0034478C49
MPELVGAGDFTTRQKFVNLVPALLSIGVVSILIVAGAPDQAPTIGRLTGRVKEYGWTGAAFITAGSVLAALLLEPLELASIRLLEGYGSPRGLIGRIRGHGVWMQQRRKERFEWILSNTADVAERRHAAQMVNRMPFESALLPTSLGNRLRHMEEQAGKPYELISLRAWPRLYLVLPESTQKVVADGRNQLDTAARLCLSLALTSVVVLGLLFRHGWWMLAALALFLLSCLAYRSAVEAAGVYATAVFAAYDVHRLKLLQAMHLNIPSGLLAERELNDDLMSLWRRPNVHPFDIPYGRTDSDVGVHHHIQGLRPDEVDAGPDG